LIDRWADKPETIRKLLATERSKANSKLGAKASVAAAAKGPRIPVPNDPLAGAQAAVNPAMAVQPAYDAATQLTENVKSRAAAYLKDARAALERHDNLAALAAWQKAAAINAAFGPDEDSPQRLANDLMRTGVDPARLVPANTNPASPYRLRPSEVDSREDNLPQLGGLSGAAPPASAMPGTYSPYNLPPERNPLAQLPTAVAEPQRLPV